MADIAGVAALPSLPVDSDDEDDADELTFSKEYRETEADMLPSGNNLPDPTAHTLLPTPKTPAGFFPRLQVRLRRLHGGSDAAYAANLWNAGAAVRWFDLPVRLSSEALRASRSPAF